MIIAEQAKQHAEAIHKAVEELNSVVKNAASDGMLIELAVIERREIMSRPAPLIQVENIAVYVGYLR